jgi:hypothetical protein
MFATAIMGSTVGVKNAIRRKARPAMRSLTHSAITKASPIDSGMVAPANHTLLVTAFQNTGSSAMAW